MIGISGVVSFRLPYATLRKQAIPLKGKLKGEPIRSISHTYTNCIVTAFDEDLQGCVAEKDEILAIVVGDIYEDDFNWTKRTSKAEYIRQAFLQGGADACVKLNGSFVFLIHDTCNRTVIIGTDKNSFIPVYYAECDEAVYFSWDISTVLETMPYRPKINYQNLFTWLLVGGREFNDETRFESVKRLEPGSFISIRAEGVTTSYSEPFYFAPDRSSEETLLSEAAESMRTAVLRRVKRLDRVVLGLSGGLDSRIILAAGVKDFDGQWICYTFGGAKCVDRDIARDVAAYYGLQHIPIKLDGLMYIDYAKDGIFYSGGASLFKHGVQLHLFSTLKSKFKAKGLLEAPALGVLIGGLLSPVAMYELKNVSELLRFYRNHIFNITREKFTGLFRDPQKAQKFYDRTMDTLSMWLSKVPGENPIDVNAAFTFEIRLKRWYNHNLVYPLYSHRLLMPTYDHDFLKVIARVPLELRRDGRFRIKLLSLLDRGAAEFPYNAWMQPAWLLPPYTQRFQKIQEEIEMTQQQVWFDSGRKVYLPSDRYDANFLEWLRVYPEYQKFFSNILTGKEAVLCDLFFKRESIQSLINRHVEGKEANHKILIMLLSAELLCRIFLKGESSGINYTFVDFSEYFKDRK